MRSRSLRHLIVGFVVVAVAAVFAAPATAAPSSVVSAAKPTGSITVSAAASLTEAFTKIGTDFQKKYKGTTATFNFAASSALALQITQGAPADVFASADEANLDKVTAAGKATAPGTIFATNKLVIVVKKGNPSNIKTLADLANAGTIALCALEVPCGKYAAQALQQAGVTIPETKITRGQDVKTTLAAVTPGDADAAIVYVTDAKSAGKTVKAVTIPTAQNVIAMYPIITLTASTNAVTAKAFVKYVVSKAGQKTLRKFGLLPPT